MIVVNMQINPPTTELAKIVHSVGPIWRRDDATEVPCQKFAILAAPNRHAGKRELWKEREHLPHQKLTPRFLSSSHHSLGSKQFRGDRLFDKHMLASGQRF